MHTRHASRHGLALVAGLALTVAGCGGPAAAQSPNEVLGAYSAALNEGRVDDAYRLLSDEAKRSVSLDAFRRAVREDPESAREIARALARPASDPLVTATTLLPGGEELRLVLEGGRWRIDAAALDLYGQATPRQAITGFLRALERKRYDVLLRYAPEAEVSGPLPGGAADAPPLTAEQLRTSWEGPQKERVTRKAEAVRAALPTAKIEETGDSAAMSYGTGGTVSLVREHGAWKVKAF